MADTNGFTVVTFNLKGKESLHTIADQIKEMGPQPDVICVQEVNFVLEAEEGPNSTTAHKLARLLDKDSDQWEVYFQGTRVGMGHTSGRKEKVWKGYGLAVLVNSSRAECHARLSFPLTPGDHPGKAGNGVKRCALGVWVSVPCLGDKRVWVVSAHVGKFATETRVGGVLTDIRSMFPGDVILGADLNAKPATLDSCEETEWCWPRKEAWIPVGGDHGLEEAIGDSFTFRPEHQTSPDSRLDFILVSSTRLDQWQCEDEEVGSLHNWWIEKAYSDHAPVRVSFNKDAECYM